MALERGAAVADKVFSPTAGYEGLSAEQVKILKELDKEREKEEQEKKKQQALQETQTGSGRGGYYRPYNRGQGFYRPYYNLHQQYGGQGVGKAGQQGQQQQLQQQQYGQQQPMHQQNQFGQMQHPMTQAPMQQQNSPGAQQPQYRPPGQQLMGRSQRPDPRAAAFCYGCGEVGHYARDNVCQPGVAAAFRAKLQQQVAAGVQPVGQQAGGAAPAPRQVAISYTRPTPPTNG